MICQNNNIYNYQNELWSLICDLSKNIYNFKPLALSIFRNEENKRCCTMRCHLLVNLWLAFRPLLFSVLNREGGVNGGHLKMPCISCFLKIPGTFKTKSTSIGSPVQLWASFGTVSGLAKVDAIVNLVEHFLDQRIRHLRSCGWYCQKERDYPTTSLRDILKAGFSGRAGFSTPIPWPLCTWRSVRDGTHLQKLSYNVNKK